MRHACALTLDLDDGSIPWDLWIDGALQARTVTNPSSGRANSSPTVPWCILGDTSGLGVDAVAGELALFERILTGEETVSLSQGFSPRFFRPSCTSPRFDSVQDEAQNVTITAIGTANTPHDIPLIYPRSQENFIQAPASSTVVELAATDSITLGESAALDRQSL